jgi:hypothetical protein
MTPSSYVRVGSHGDKPCVVLGNTALQVKVATTGCQIVSVTTHGGGANPLWTPPWRTTTAALRKVAALDDALFSRRPEDALESELLACIGGHSLCCDVFGKHSAGEVSRAGLSFHGEAGLSEFVVTSVGSGGEDGGSTDGSTSSTVTLTADLRESMLRVSRTFTLCPRGSPVVKVTETITNLAGFQRAMGRSQHVSLDMTQRARRFNTNARRGLTWPEDNGAASLWAVGAEFDVKEGVPRKDGGRDDWFRFPRKDAPRQSDLCTLHVPGADRYGWFTCATDDDVLCYLWERETFPWLMTWEEHCARDQPPWGGRTSVRGLEFGSYALALGRQKNVEMGTLFGTPTFEWLDAHEMKTTHFFVSLQALEGVGGAGGGGAADRPASALEMEDGGGAYASSEGVRIELF